MKFCKIFCAIALINISNAFSQFQIDKIELSSFMGFENRVFNYHPLIRYNRVEGLFQGAGLAYTAPFLPAITLHGEGGYGVSNESWRYRAGIYKEFFEFNKLRIGGEFFHRTYSLDDWYIGTYENSLAALFLKEDFKNYFSRRGFKAYVRKVFLDNQLQLGIEASGYEDESMERKTNWSLFGRNKDFRENPGISKNNETSLKFIFSFDKRDNLLFPLSGWLLEGLYENTSGDFDTHGLFLILKNFIPTFGSQRIRTRTMFGTRVGSETEQHTMDLGGLGTLPGFRDKEFRNGNRFFLFNFNYSVGGDILRRFPPCFTPIYDMLMISLFFDTGWLRLVKDEKYDSFKGFDKMRLDQLNTDVGVEISVSEEIFAIQFAKRTDRSWDDWRILCRLMYKF